jgi:hypothetical protein
MIKVSAALELGTGRLGFCRNKLALLAREVGLLWWRFKQETGRIEGNEIYLRLSADVDGLVIGSRFSPWACSVPRTIHFQYWLSDRGLFKLLGLLKPRLQF